MKTLVQTAALLAAVLLVAPGPLHATEAALGDDGALYRVESGGYGALFPTGTAAEPESPVLALEVSAPGEPRLRRLVPGSEDAALDLSPALIFEASSSTAYVIWESRREEGGSSLLLAGLRGDEWIGPLELSGDTAPLKRAPTVMVTRDEVSRPTITEGQVLQSRTVLHVVWWEQAEGGQPAVQYTPVVMEDGTYVGWNPVFRLDALDPNEPSPKLAGHGSSELYRSPTLSPGTDVLTAVIAFANARTGRLLTVQARVLPGELGLLANRIPAAVVEAGYGDGEDRLEAIRGVLRAQIIEIGARFNPGVIRHFAEAAVVAAEVLHESKPKRPIEALADDLRAQIIEIGAQVLGDVKKPAFVKAGRVIEVEGSDETAGTDLLSSLVHLRLVRELPVPDGAEGSATVYPSEDGERLLVSWRTDDGISYVESLPEPRGAEGEATYWTERHALDLGEAPDPGLVESILRARVLSRP